MKSKKLQVELNTADQKLLSNIKKTTAGVKTDADAVLWLIRNYSPDDSALEEIKAELAQINTKVGLLLRDKESNIFSNEIKVKDYNSLVKDYLLKPRPAPTIRATERKDSGFKGFGKKGGMKFK